MKYLFVMDPAESINRETDSTLLMMHESSERGHHIYYCRVEDLYIKAAASFASLRPVQFNNSSGIFCLGEPEDTALSDVDAIFMRKDPPFDMNYVYATQILELASKDTFIINDPKGVRGANEKLYALNFPGAIPETIVSRDTDRLKSFLEEVGGEMIIKPLGKCGGEGIFYIKRGDRNINALLETSTSFGKEFIMGQRYIPEIKNGDKRIILIDGEPVGAVSRVPQDDEHRGNIHIGGKGFKCDITDRDKELCRIIAPRLKEDGLYFVGLDVIGDWITEINVTSPTCLVEINNLNNVKIEKTLIDFVEDRVKNLYK
ncbi:MAG: glutathione synthase [bacterium]|nr:glutathione synthase [bacterium]